MRRKSTLAWNKVVAKLLVAVMVMLAVAVGAPTAAVKAATTPKLNSSTRNILVGKTYDLNVIGKVKKSTYAWTTSDKKVATVDNWGVVKGIKKGTATITCKIVTPAKKTYNLKSKITVIAPADTVEISNKVSALNVGQTISLKTSLSPKSTNDPITWTSSKKSVATVDKNGKVTAIKEGTVTITAKAFSGRQDKVTIKVVGKEGIVTTQKELDSLLASGVSLITIKTDAEVSFVIANGEYKDTNLVVDAPNADVNNNGVFKSIEIKQIKANTWYENAAGNLLKVLAADSRIVVGSNAKVSIEVTKDGAKLKIENNGVIEEIVIDKKAALTLSGESTDSVPVVVNVPNITITSSVPLNLECNAKIELVLLAGAEGTKVNAESKDLVPIIKGDVKVEVTVNGETTETGSDTTNNNGGPIGGGGGGTTTPLVTVVNNADGSVSYVLAKSYTELKSITISYLGVSYTVDSAMLAELVRFLGNEATTIQTWKDTTNTTKTYGSQTVTVTGTTGSSTKTVTFVGGLLDGKAYTATVGNSSVTLRGNVLSFTITKSGNNTLIISSTPSGLVFTPSF